MKRLEGLSKPVLWGMMCHLLSRSWSARACEERYIKYVGWTQIVNVFECCVKKFEFWNIVYCASFLWCLFYKGIKGMVIWSKHQVTVTVLAVLILKLSQGFSLALSFPNLSQFYANNYSIDFHLNAFTVT